MFAINAVAESSNPYSLASYCKRQLNEIPGRVSQKKSENLDLDLICSQVKMLKGCHSYEYRPIFHYDKEAKEPGRGKRILAISLIHGDEFDSGHVSSAWVQRLADLEPRNQWRVIPVANPDGLDRKTRTNGRGVDLNRNFPTGDWNDKAMSRWENKRKKDPRRFPGFGPGSEIETKCLISHFDDFNPDFIISIHTPLGVLDFDGPKMSAPRLAPLPWISLGNFPGSLGRYMWKEKDIPVLTIELRGDEGIKSLEKFDQLQDVSGTVAIQADRLMRKKKKLDSAKKEGETNRGS